MIAETKAVVGNIVGLVLSPVMAVGTGLRGFALAHPVGMAVTGGVIVGAGAYYAANKYLLNKEAAEEG